MVVGGVVCSAPGVVSDRKYFFDVSKPLRAFVGPLVTISHVVAPDFAMTIPTAKEGWYVRADAFSKVDPLTYTTSPTETLESHVRFVTVLSPRATDE